MLNPQESAEAIVRGLLQRSTEGLNLKERRKRCVCAKSNDSGIFRKGGFRVDNKKKMAYYIFD